MTMVWLSAQHLDVSLHLGNILKKLQNLGCNEKADKYVLDRSVAFDLVFRELCHYLMTMECGQHNCGGIFHSWRTQLVPPQNADPREFVKKSASAGRIEGRRCLSLITPGTTECWSPHPYELEASLWSCRITPLVWVQDFIFSLGGQEDFW